VDLSVQFRDMENDKRVGSIDPAKLQEEQESSKARIEAFSELLFVILPFIVIAITLGHRSELRTILFLPEWSIVSAVITGQSIVRISSTAMDRSLTVQKEPIVLILSVLLVCLLVPILVVLSIVLTSDKVSTALAAVQSVLFVASAIVFWTTKWLEASVLS
jgi:hypothetical protein